MTTYIKNPVISFGIEPEQLAELIAFLSAMMLKHSHPKMTRIAMMLLLSDYNKKWSLLDMWAYLKLATSDIPGLFDEDRGEPDLIYQTIVHDLNGRNDPFFSPRTDGYYKIWKETQ